MKILLIILVSWISLAEAFVVEVQGQAPIAGPINYARQQALEDAMRQASLRAEAHVVSTQLMSKGAMLQDDIELKSQARVRMLRFYGKEPKTEFIAFRFAQMLSR